jgi:hypothetical protein
LTTVYGKGSTTVYSNTVVVGARKLCISSHLFKRVPLFALEIEAARIGSPDAVYASEQMLKMHIIDIQHAYHQCRSTFGLVEFLTPVMPLSLTGSASSR